MLAVKNQNPILNQHIILKPRDRIGIVSIKGNFEMKHTISRNNAQYFFALIARYCAMSGVGDKTK